MSGKGNKSRIDILVVDDKLVIREIVSQVLSERECRTIQASDGSEAILILNEKKDEIDVILTDLMMPNMKGEKLIKMAREIAPKIPIVVMSGAQAMEGLEDLELMDSPKFLSKLATSEQILTAIQDSLSEKEGSFV